MTELLKKNIIIDPEDSDQESIENGLRATAELEAELKMLISPKVRLYKKMAVVAKEIGAMKKMGDNTFDGYKYITYEQIENKIRLAQEKHGFFIHPVVVESTEKQYGKEKLTFRTYVTMEFTIIDFDTGFELVFQFQGADSDRSKSLSQAITECTKRCYTKLFHISSTDTDPDSRTVESFANGKTVRKLYDEGSGIPEDSSWCEDSRNKLRQEYSELTSEDKKVKSKELAELGPISTWSDEVLDSLKLWVEARKEA